MTPDGKHMCVCVCAFCCGGVLNKYACVMGIHQNSHSIAKFIDNAALFDFINESQSCTGTTKPTNPI